MRLNNTWSLGLLGILVSGFCVANAGADELLEINGRPNHSVYLSGAYLYSARNVGSGPVTIVAGQFNGRDDCMLAPYTENIIGSHKQLRDAGAIVESARAWAKRGQAEAIELGTFELNVGESMELRGDGSPCTENGSDIVRIMIRTTTSEFSFSTR